MNQYELSFTAETIDSMLASLFAGKVFGGEIETYSPIPTDTRVYYVALNAGYYTNFDFTLAQGEFAFVWHDGTEWTVHKYDMSVVPRILNVSDIAQLTDAQCDSLRVGDIVVAETCYTVTSKDYLALFLASASYTTIKTVGYINIDGGWQYAQTKITDTNAKADKVNGATSGNFAGLDSNGNLTDSGIAPSSLATQSDISGFVTNTVNNLTNYYLKSETYTQAEVNALIGAIQNFHYEIYATLPNKGASNVLYLIGPTGSGADRYEEYVYANNVFTKIGDTSIDLSGYVTTSALNTALADYTTTSNLTALLSNKADKVSNATNGNFAGLDANGNLTDSGKKASDFLTQEQAGRLNYFKGWYDSSSNLPSNPVVGDYAFVKGTESSDPAAIYECTTAGTWSDSGRTADTSNVQTFATSQEVNETYIDDTHLVNPKSSALPTAEDVMQLKAKLEGVTAEEIKIVPNDSNIEYGNYINGDTGLLANPSTPSGNNCLTVNVNGAKSVRFIGLLLKSAPSANGSGYAFWDANDTPITNSYSKWDFDTSISSNDIKEYFLYVPANAVTFKLTLPTSYSVFTMDKFYMYVQNGESVNEALLGYNDDSIVSEIDYASMISSGNIALDMTTLNGGSITRGGNARTGYIPINQISTFKKIKIIGMTSAQRGTQLIFTKKSVVELPNDTYDYQALRDSGYLCDNATSENWIVSIPSSTGNPNGIVVNIPSDAQYVYIKRLRSDNYGCAPSSVLPFSQHIQGEVEKKIDEKLEDYITVVDSLESDSQTDALSANQGRIIGGQLSKLKLISFFELGTYSLLGTGKWGTSSDYAHSIIPVVAGEKYRIRNYGDADNIRYAFLTSDECVAGGDIPLVTGTQVVTVAAGTNADIVIPEGCSYITFTEDKPGYNSYNVTFYKIVGVGDADFYENVPNFTETLPIDVSSYHALWDELVEKGIARRSEAYYMSWDANEEYPIYTYRISRERDWMNSSYIPNQNTDYSNPLYQRKKIIVTCGIHGCERLTPNTFVKWVKEHYSDALFAALDFVIIPLCNPWGYSHTLLDSQGVPDLSHMDSGTIPSGYSVALNSEIDTSKVYGIRRTRSTSTDTQLVDVNRDFNDEAGFNTEEAQYIRDVYIAEKPDMVIDFHQDLNSGTSNAKCGFVACGYSAVFADEWQEIRRKLATLTDMANYDTDNYINRCFVEKKQYSFTWGSKTNVIDTTNGVWKNYAAGGGGNTEHTDCAAKYTFTDETDVFCRMINGNGTPNNLIARKYGYLYMTNFLKYIFNVFEMK